VSKALKIAEMCADVNSGHCQNRKMCQHSTVKLYFDRMEANEATLLGSENVFQNNKIVRFLHLKPNVILSDMKVTRRN